MTSDPPPHRVHRVGRLLGLLAGLALSAWGASMLADSLPLRQPRPVRVADLEAGQQAPSRWLELSGTLRAEDRIIWPRDGSHDTYVPVVSDGWRPGLPVAAFVRAREENWGSPGRLLNHPGPSVTGLVDPEGLPGEVRAWFSRNELPPAAAALVIAYETEPAADVMLGYCATGAGLVLLVNVALFWLGQRRGPARSLPGEDPSA